jgi:lactoylglutathione lyase
VFGVKVDPLYTSRNKPGFSSRFIRFASGPAFEIMTGPWIKPDNYSERVGYAHIAISVGTVDEVDRLASDMKLEKALVSGPRWTGDGFYEAVIRDPGGSLIEITV